MNLLFISLGCDKNLVDTEKMLGILGKEGYSFVDDENEADIVVVNTCCFIGDAKEESINTILQMAELKKNGRLKALIVTGCLAQRYKQEIIDEIPEVDAILGTTSYEAVGAAIREVMDGETPEIFESIDAPVSTATERLITTGGHYAFLKIAEGCDKRCTYCIIPYLRGKYRSVPMEQLVREAEELAEKGVKELILVAQETTLYGKDLYGEKKLPELLRRLAAVSGIQWIRLQYCYPEEITDELIDTIAQEKKIVPYLDIPIQHCNDGILKAMNRRDTKESIRKVFHDLRARIPGLIAKLRKEIPDIALRTTLISGFPGETEEDHEILMQFVDDMEFDRLGVFAYSPEEDTPAFSFENQVPEEVKQDRRDEIMELQQEIAFEKSEAMKGRTLEVMIEGKVADENAYVGRTYMDSPNVDGLIFVNTGLSLMSGDFLKVRVTGASEYDLIGEAEDEFTE